MTPILSLSSVLQFTQIIKTFDTIIDNYKTQYIKILNAVNEQ